MADVRPFCGIRFDPRIAGDLGTVICPPYDVISPELQHALHHKSPYNMVRIEYGLTQQGDNLFENKYSRAAAAFSEWMEKGVLRADSAPAMYVHHHYFNHHGEVKTRRGIFTAVRLEEWEKGTIRPHEGTAAVFKADRLNLMRACQANVSPVFSLYEDPESRIADVLAHVEKGEPLFRIAAPDDESHTLWAIRDREALHAISSSLEKRPLYIADGHHRYETALTYRNERRAAFPLAGGDSAFNFGMMALVEFSDPGLVVLPFHRMVRGVRPEALTQLRTRLGKHFEVDTAPLDCPLSFSMLHRILKPVSDESVVLGVLGLQKDSLLIVRLTDRDGVSAMLPAGRSEAYRSLDVSILHHVILAGFLGIGEGENIAYTKSELEAWQRVAGREYQLAFLLNPIAAYAVKAVADACDKMPQKSTHFYPKLPTGLVLNSLDGAIS